MFDYFRMIKIFLWILVVSLIMLSYVEARCEPGNKNQECDLGEVWIFLFFNRAAFHFCVHNYVHIDMFFGVNHPLEFKSTATVLYFSVINPFKENNTIDEPY